MAKLLVKKDGVVTQSFELKPGINCCGRKPENDFAINDASISGRHCEIEKADKDVIVRDLGSTNGTFIDGQAIEEATLNPGQILRLGNVEIFCDAPVPALSVKRITLAKTNELPPGMVPHVDIEPAAIASSSSSVRLVKPESPLPIKQDFCRSFPPLPAPAASKTFFQSLPEAFVYPLKRDGLILLICGTVLFLILDFFQTFGHFFMVGWLIVSVFSFGYIAAYMQKIISSSAQGEEDLPGWPELSNYWDDILHPALLLVGSFAVSFGPAMAFWIFVDWELSTKLMVGLSLATFGCLFLPMALVAVSMYESLFALNPLLIIPSILRIPREYFTACLMLGLVAGMRIASTWLMEKVAIPILPTVIVSFLSLYFVTLEMRILGVLYYTKQDDLSWKF
ncbi:MAG: FHA domain-containing protein [Verrucomicrobiota bacterium]|nr:FHA domain-containing protein [Verrucomicrobiota bacterium]